MIRRVRLAALSRCGRALRRRRRRRRRQRDARRIGQGEGQLNVIAWEGYTQPQWVKPFEKETGCQVNSKYAGSSDEMVT